MSPIREPREGASMFPTERQFTLGLVNYSTPIALVHGGTYARENEFKIQVVLPIVFPFEMREPDMNR